MLSDQIKELTQEEMRKKSERLVQIFSKEFDTPTMTHDSPLLKFPDYFEGENVIFYSGRNSIWTEAKVIKKLEGSDVFLIEGKINGDKITVIYVL